MQPVLHANASLARVQAEACTCQAASPAASHLHDVGADGAEPLAARNAVHQDLALQVSPPGQPPRQRVEQAGLATAGWACSTANKPGEQAAAGKHVTPFARQEVSTLV